MEEKNRTLQKIVVERDNVIAYLQAKMQSPHKGARGDRGDHRGDHRGDRRGDRHARRGDSYRELDLDGMDAEEYVVFTLSPLSPSHPLSLSLVR